MRTRVRTGIDPMQPNVFASIITDVMLEDVDRASCDEGQFKELLARIYDDARKAVADILVPRIQEAVLARIDIDTLVTEAIKARIREVLFK